MNKEILETKKLKDKLGKLHVFKMAPRAERNHRIRIVYETGELGPILKVTGSAFKGKSKYNLGKQGVRFYDPDTKTAYVKWAADDELLLAAMKEDKALINITGEFAEGKSQDGGVEKYFRIYGTEVTSEMVE